MMIRQSKSDWTESNPKYFNYQHVTAPPQNQALETIKQEVALFHRVRNFSLPAASQVAAALFLSAQESWREKQQQATTWALSTHFTHGRGGYFLFWLSSNTPTHTPTHTHIHTYTHTHTHRALTTTNDCVKKQTSTVTGRRKADMSQTGGALLITDWGCQLQTHFLSAASHRLNRFTSSALFITCDSETICHN